MSLQKVKYTDADGVLQTVTADLAKGVAVEDIPTNLEWDLVTKDAEGVVRTIKHVGGRPKDRG